MVGGGGSSPHSRGTRHAVKQSDGSAGIIPAFAGNTSGKITADPMFRDHPRIRGEHASGDRYTKTTTGSSPHSRGTRRCFTVRARGNGIIPAFAGNTAIVYPVPTARQDHPRIRGEHFGKRTEAALVAGSSPHSRGTLPRKAGRISRNRIIPAFAGNTTSSFYLFSLGGDHPRIRGEHTKKSP